MQHITLLCGPQTTGRSSGSENDTTADALGEEKRTLLLFVKHGRFVSAGNRAVGAITPSVCAVVPFVPLPRVGVVVTLEIDPAGSCHGR